MFVALSHVIPQITTGLALVALIVLLIAFLIYCGLRIRENLIKGARPVDRLKLLNATLSRFEVETAELSPEQKFDLAIAQISLRRTEQGRRVALLGFLAILLCFLAAYTIGRFSSISPRQVVAANREPVPDNPSEESSSSPIAGPPDTVKGSVIKLPFAVRLLADTTLADEPVEDEKVTVTDSVHPLPTPALRDGEFFVVETTETEQTTIHIAAYAGAEKVERTVMISGYIASQVPCDRRTVYLAKQPFVVNKETRAIALRYLADVTHCGSVDKALVAWEAIHNATSDTKASSVVKFKNIGDLIDYNWARGNYQSCVTLGYEQQCAIGEAAFRDLGQSGLQNLDIRPGERKKITADINVMPLQIEYTQLQNYWEL